MNSLNLKSNRLVSKRQATDLEPESRIRLERYITDAKDKEKVITPIPANWNFESWSAARPWRRHLYNFLGPLKGKSILDVGCGYRPTPIYFALAGARHVCAFDVSPKAIDHINRLAVEYSVEDRVQAIVAAAEDLPLPANGFDLAHGEGTLHHLVLDEAGPELSRVLKQGGRAAFKDPLGHNPVLEFIRDYVPHGWRNHHVKGTDHPMTFDEIETFGKYFTTSTHRSFDCVSMIPTFFRLGRHARIRNWTDRLDDAILSGAPFLNRLCRFVVTCVVN